MEYSEWIDAKTPPAKDGYYMVKFYFPYRHPTDRIEIACRLFSDGHWDVPYYSTANEDGKLIAWQEME